MAGRLKPAPAGGYLVMPLGDFLDEVASPQLVPGAGYTSAVAVAMAAGLVAMASRRSVGLWPEAGGAAAQAEALRIRVVPLAQRNVDAYLEAVAVLDGSGEEALPDRKVGTEHGPHRASSGSRDDEIAVALERAALIPLEIAEAAVDVAGLAAEVAELGEPSVRADAAAAGALALAGARGAAVLVEVNLTTTASDDRVARARAFVAGAEAAVERAAAVVG